MLGCDIACRAEPARSLVEGLGPDADHPAPRLAADRQRRMVDRPPSLAAIAAVEQVIRKGQRPVPRAEAPIVAPLGADGVPPLEEHARPAAPVEEIERMSRGTEQAIVFD